MLSYLGTWSFEKSCVTDCSSYLNFLGTWSLIIPRPLFSILPSPFCIYPILTLPRPLLHLPDFPFCHVPFSIYPIFILARPLLHLTILNDILVHIIYMLLTSTYAFFVLKTAGPPGWPFFFARNFFMDVYLNFVSDLLIFVK